MRRFTTTALLLALALAGTASAQGVPSPETEDAYLDATARVLVERARASRSRSQSDLLAYTAIIRQRISAALRTPLKDRTVFRAESAARVRWDRDNPIIAQILAERMQHPAGVEIDEDVGGLAIDQVFDPSSDRLMFGLADEGDEDEIWIRHPLAFNAEYDYRFRSGDTLTLDLPDGRRLRTVELEVLPRRASPDLLRGTLWIEPGSGMLARAAFKLARKMNVLKDGHLIDADLSEEEFQQEFDEIPPGMRALVESLVLPIEFNVDLAVVEYALWEYRHWLPSVMRLEGVARAGIFEAPGALELSYEILSVEDEHTLAADTVSGGGELAPDPITESWLESGEGYHVVDRQRNGRDVIVLVPNRREALAESPFLPPPIWQDAPEFISMGELRELEDLIADVPLAQRMPVQWDARWGLEQFGLVRYNRVEALSVGAIIDMEKAPFHAWATGRIGVADVVPNVELGLQYSGTRRALGLDLYHRLATVTGTERALGLGNSTSALLFGRDDGEYYRTTGARLSLRPPPDHRDDVELSLWAERHRRVTRNTNVSLPAAWTEGWMFRDNLAADAADQLGTTFRYRRWWGDGLGGAQLGADLDLLAATGDYRYARGRLTLRTSVPVTSEYRLGLEAAGGTSAGDVPVQRFWHLGGVQTLRGYSASAAAGPSFLRGRAELVRSFVGSAAGAAVFGDIGWAGRPNGFTLEDALDNALYSVGAGFTIMEGLIRMDLARALSPPTGWRLDMYLDATL